MPELKLDDCENKILPIGLSTELSLYVEKGKVELIFKEDNFPELREIFVAGQKKSWNKLELLPYNNVVITGLSPFVVIHYSLV